MKRLTAVLALAAVATLTLTGLAQETTSKPNLLYGKVVSVDAAKGTIVVAPKEGPQVTVTTDAKTKFTVGDKPATLADIKPDMGIRVSPGTGTAEDVRAFAAKPSPAPAPTSKPNNLLYGTVVSVDAAKGTVVIAPKQGEQATVTTDAKTKIQVDGKEAKLDDVKAGMVLRVEPATGTAADVRAFTPKK